MRNLTEDNLTEIVLASLANCTDPRLKDVMTSLLSHLHAFVREVEPTPEEWFAGIRFLTETGHMCDDRRQEFILLSDTWGVSMLVDAINNRKTAGATESSVLGPFYVEGAPERDNGADLAPGEGPGVAVRGHVRSTDGKPIAGALLDIWQTAPNGLYHVQDGAQEEYHLCGKVRTAADGSYRFRTLKPVPYAIPTDGPVGKWLGRVGRHPNRPAHIHFIVSAPGFKPVVTQLFTEGDEYLDSDAVFGVKQSLVIDYQPASGEWRASHDFVLEPDAA
ncbi:MAG: intradiol ring-cleavage dioxygenase [Rhodocyclaceae bacterium]|nr:intradiol ring-cleavage dioxygenase [Rhodocyclaceae bacterium]